MTDSKNLPTISIITVVFNDIKHIAHTIKSILNQTYPNIEYIIIDGASTDGTVQMIQTFIDHPLPTFKHKITTFISEKDKGIYDAMNKGVKSANGQWCNFMNSGDSFYENTTIEKMFLNLDKTPKNKLGVIYGHSKLIYDEQHSKILYSNSQKHKYRHQFVHQSSFISTALLRQYPYDTRFKITADADFFAKIYHKGFFFEKKDIVVSEFDLNGISSDFSYQVFKEWCLIGYKYNPFYPIFFSIKTIFYILPRLYIRKLLPKKLLNAARVKLSKNKI